jgi:fructose-bisphosphate aldolase class I
MASVDTGSIAKAIVSDGKGILAADETPGTLSKRFEALKIQSTSESRREYREMLFTTPRIARFIGGVIMQDETIHQKSSTGQPLAEILSQQGIIPGIKVDAGAKRLAGTDENITEGLDGLRNRLKDYATMGARFAKWRAVGCRAGHAFRRMPMPSLGTRHCVKNNRLYPSLSPKS